ncbi:hypothetical protein B0H12DRAFT_264741 [Mycena haematopus]|nr:hypothetical protein B0H12DRAFT_264741 [Mycena haematopus]
MSSTVPETMIQDDGSEGDLELLYPDSDAESDSTSTTAHAAPAPTAPRSHSRHRSEQHISRPLNSFMCFRKHFCQLNNERGPEAVRDHSVVSQLAARAWKELSPAEKKKFKDIAQEKKKLHFQKYPGYTYRVAARSEGNGNRKKRKADDDCDYEDHVPQPKRRRSQARAQHLGLRMVLDADSEREGNVSLVSSQESSLASTARSCAPSPEPPCSRQSPELSPKSSPSFSSSESPDPALRTPTMTFPQLAHDNEFVATSDIPFLDLNSEKAEETKIERFQRSPSFEDVGSQFFKPDIPSQTRDSCTWHPTYSSDGSYILPVPFSPVSSPSADDGVPPINYDAVQFTNPFSFEPFELEMSNFDRF